MYDEISAAKHIEFKGQALLHGIDIDKESDAPKKEKPASVDNPNMVFGDPDEYDNMSEEDKEALTEKMMSQHKSWAGQKLK